MWTRAGVSMHCLRAACPLLVLSFSWCVSACESSAPAAEPATSHPLFINQLPFPPLRTPLSRASPELRRLVDAFGGFLGAAQLPEVDKRDFRKLSPYAIAERKRRWVDEQVVRRFRELGDATAELDKLAALVPPDDPVERVAASALAGCALRMVANDWASLGSGSALFLLGPKASIPADFTVADVDAVTAKELQHQPEVNAYFEERAKSVPAPDPQGGLQQLTACVEGASREGGDALTEWRSLCEEWLR